MKPREEAEHWRDLWTHGCFLLAGHDDALGVGGFDGERLAYDWAAECWRETPEYRRHRETVLEPRAREAWGRLGRMYLDEVADHRNGRYPPGAWALEVFGEPEQCQ